MPASTRNASTHDRHAEPRWGLGAAMGLTALSLHVGSVELLALGSTELPAFLYTALAFLGLVIVGLLAAALATTSAWLRYGAHERGMTRRGRASLTLIALGTWTAATAATGGLADLLVADPALLALAPILLGAACASAGLANLARDGSPSRGLLTTGALTGAGAGLLLAHGPIFGALAASLAIIALAQTWGVGVPRHSPRPTRS